jgi:uncharacterized protein YggE
MKRILFSLLILPISVLAEGGLPNQPYIYVEGQAEIQKPADMIELHFEVVARGPDEAKVNQEAQAKANKILSLCDSRKIATNDVVAETLKSEPEFDQSENPPGERGKVIGYRVARPFDVRVRDVNAFPKLVDDLIPLGGVEFAAIESRLSKEKEVQDELWNKALINARDRADKTVKAAGLKIDSIFAISPTRFPQILQGLFGEVERVIVTGKAPLIEPESASHYRLAPVTMTETVHVIYLISPAK